MATIKLDDIVWEPSLYPREKWHNSTIEQYADVLKSGKKFPPIVLETGTNILLDGKHRVESHKMYAKQYAERQSSMDFKEGQDDWAQPSDEIEVEYHTIPDGVPVKLYAASLSVKHGDRIKPAERKAIAREIMEENPDFTLATLAEYLGISLGSSHSYVADLLARRKETQKMIALRLNLLGWTQDEQAAAIGMQSQGSYHKFLSQFSDLKKEIKKLLSDGHPHLDVAERYNMPLQLVWAIDMEGRTDKQRMERLGINVQPYDVWNFAKCHDLFGSQHPGRIPGELIAHVLYFYTKPGDKVIDPMVGSGTTLDTCLVFGRECYGFDIDERHDRPDVIKHNISIDGWHERIKKADLIFWDPPYFEKMDSSNIGDNGYIEGSISKLGRDEYLQFFAKRLNEANSLVKKDTKLAFLMSDWDDNTGEREGIFIWDYANIIMNTGWKLIRHIQVPLSTQQVHPDIVNKFRDSRRFAGLDRYLLIAQAQ